MMKYVKMLVEYRVKKLPVTNILKDPFMMVGSVFGGAWGFSNSLHHSDGLVWRTSLGMVGGGVVGFTVGLFPYQALGLAFMGDVAYTLQKYGKRTSR